jgi:hypothetical protein
VKSIERTIAPRTRRYTRTYSSRHPELVQSDLVRSRRHLKNEREVMGGGLCNPMNTTQQGEQVQDGHHHTQILIDEVLQSTLQSRMAVGNV